MHAAAKDGSLPESLDEIKLVPIPLDPVTGKPFSYTKAGETATLSGPPPVARPASTHVPDHAQEMIRRASACRWPVSTGPTPFWFTSRTR